MTKFIVPAYCPTCGAIFPSGFELEVGAHSFSFDNCQSGPCPNWHMGLVLDGTFNATEGMLEVVRAGKITPHILNEIQAISDGAIKGKQEPKSALDEIVDLLPVGLAAPIKKLGASNPLVTILVILAVANAVGLLETNLTTVYRNLVPPDPQSHPTLEAHSPRQSARDR